MVCSFRRRLICSLPVTLLSATPVRAEQAATTWIASDAGLYKISASPASAKAPVGRFHQWTISVVSTRGVAVSGARVSIGGGMPGHGHGLPSQPQVTREIAVGQYLVEGMRFNMPGQWEITVAIAAPGGRDIARLTVQVSL